MTKKECRRQFRKTWSEMTEETLTHISTQICREIRDSAEWREASIVMAYLSFGKEIDLDQLIKESLTEGKTVAVPLIESRGEMRFRIIREWNTELFILNRWGIREPGPDTPVLSTDRERAHLVLVPGLGFSRDGRRMGRGGGYYDRYLKQSDLSRCHLMGISCEAVLSDVIPVVPHDIPVQSICTEKGIIRP